MGKVKEDWWKLIVLITMMTLIVIGLSSCKQVQYVPIEKIVTKDSIIIKKEYDSIEIKVKEYVDGGIQYRDSIVYHCIFRTDTIYKIERDSIPYPVEVIKEVKAPLNWYQKAMIRLGWALIVLLVAIVGWKVAKWYFKLKG